MALKHSKRDDPADDLPRSDPALLYLALAFALAAAAVALVPPLVANWL